MMPGVVSERSRRTLVPTHGPDQQAENASRMIERVDAERERVFCENQFRSLSKLLDEVREDERRGLARELHDRVGQNLTALDLNLNVICATLSLDPHSQAGERIHDCLRLVARTMETVSDVMTELQSVGQNGSGLMAALHWQGKLFSQRTGVPARITGLEPALQLSAAVQHSLVRIAQEAFTNAAKHARASQVTLLLESSPGRVQMTVADDGCGFVPSAIPSNPVRSGYGLQIMRERAEAVGGTFRIESRRGMGSCVIVNVGGG